MEEKDIYSNSIGTAKKEESPEIKKVVKRSAVVKKSKSTVFKELFFPEDVPDVKKYIIQDVIVPGIKGAFLNFWSFLLTGRPYSGGYTKNSNVYGSRVSYNDYYQQGTNPNKGEAPVIRSGFNDPLYFETRSDAEMVVDALEETISRYGKARVADLYEMAGVTGTPEMNNYGWENIAGFLISPNGTGCILTMPEARPINR